MKKLIALILVVFMTLTVIGCSDENANSSVNSESNLSNNTESSNTTGSLKHSVTTTINDTVKCELEVIDGQYYLLNFGKDISNIIGSGMPATDIAFKSIDEFVNTIKGGNFTRGQYNTMVNHFKKDGSGRIKICNPNKIYEPIAPDKAYVAGVNWTGEKYSCDVQTLDAWWALFIIHTKETFEEKSAFHWDHYGRGFEFDKSKKYPDYTEINYTTGIVDIKLKRYTLETNAATYEKALAKTQMCVEEKYYLRSENPKFTASSEIPYLITIFVENDDVQYEVQIRDIKSPVTPEWLLQFGLKPRS